MKKSLVFTASLCVAFACLSLSAIHTNAQGDPPKEITRLKSLPGMWNGSITGTMDGKKVKGTVRHLYRSCSNGWGMEMNENMNLDSMPQYSCINLFGFNAGDKKLHVYSVSNFGDTHDHSGTWSSDKSLSLEYISVVNGKPFKEKLDITFDTDSTYHFTVKATEDGKETLNVSASMTKAPTPKRLDMIRPRMRDEKMMPGETPTDKPVDEKKK